jgi:hypothetical protein
MTYVHFYLKGLAWGCKHVSLHKTNRWGALSGADCACQWDQQSYCIFIRMSTAKQTQEVS